MNKVLVFLLFVIPYTAFCKKKTEIWKYIENGKDSVFHLSSEEGQTYIPYYNEFVSMKIFDNLSIDGVHNDSIVNDSMNSPNYLPKRILIKYGKLILYYDQRVTVDKPYIKNIIQFSITPSNKVVTADSVDYEFFYIKNIGVVAAIKKTYGENHMFLDWDRCLLIKKQYKNVSKRKLRTAKKYIGKICKC